MLQKRQKKNNPKTYSLFVISTDSLEVCLISEHHGVKKENATYSQHIHDVTDVKRIKSPEKLQFFFFNRTDNPFKIPWGTRISRWLHFWVKNQGLVLYTSYTKKTTWSVRYRLINTVSYKSRNCMSKKQTKKNTYWWSHLQMRRCYNLTITQIYQQKKKTALNCFLFLAKLYKTALWFIFEKEKWRPLDDHNVL